MNSIFIGLFVGAAVGFLYGASIASNSRDGIYPDVWAILIAVFAVFGAILGTISLLFI